MVAVRSRNAAGNAFFMPRKIRTAITAKFSTTHSQ
jgi:hypothetical protein